MTMRDIVRTLKDGADASLDPSTLLDLRLLLGQTGNDVRSTLRPGGRRQWVSVWSRDTVIREHDVVRER